MPTLQLSWIVSHFKALKTKTEEREKVVAAMLTILGGGWLPLLGVILLDPSLSPLKATAAPAGILSHRGGCVGAMDSNKLN